MARQNSIKIEHNGIVFDSQTEYFYYLHLLENGKAMGISEIIPHPPYEIIPAHVVQCVAYCQLGKVNSPKTGKTINCPKCKGKGYKYKQPAIYTPDFELVYEDGHHEIIDVKGGFIQKDFPLRKKIFESRYGQHVFVVKWDRVKGWVKK